MSEPSDGMKLAAYHIANCIGTITEQGMANFIAAHVGPELAARDQRIAELEREKTALKNKIIECVSAYVERLNKAEAEAAAMRPLIATCRRFLSTTIVLAGHSMTRRELENTHREIGECDAALNGTAGQDLLDDVKRLREIVKRVDATCVSALPSHPEGPDNAVQAGVMDMAVDVLNIIRDQLASEVSK